MNWEKLKNKLTLVPSWCWLILILILGAALRLINISAEPLWADEILSLSITHHFPHLATLIQYLAETEVHPPLYYIMLHFWTGWFGMGTEAIRLLSLIFGLGCIWLGFILGKRIFHSQKIGLIAALLLAILPLQIEYGQEARPYIIFCFFAGVSMLAIWEYLDSGKKIWLPIYVACSLVGMYLHYSYLFFLAGISLFWLFDIFWSQKTSRNRLLLIWLITNSFIVLGFSFWLVPLFYRLILATAPVFGLFGPFSLDRQPDFFMYVIDQIGWVSKFIEISRFIILLKFLVQILIVIVVLNFIRKTELIGKYKRELLFLLWMFLLPLCFFLVSYQSAPYSYIIVRHVLYASLPLTLILAFLIGQMKPKIAVVFCMIFISSLLPFISDIVGNDAGYDQYFQFQNAAQMINELSKPGDIVVMESAGIRSDLNFYLNDSTIVVDLKPTNYFGLDIWNSKETLGLIENAFNQLRYTPASDREIRNKLDRIDKIYHPKRYWLYGVDAGQTVVHDWFLDHKLNHRIRSLGNIMKLDLYSY